MHILNVYCILHKSRVTLPKIYRAIKSADKEPLVTVGNFNAASLHWGYHFEKARGRKLADPECPTRRIRDLSLIQNATDAAWENLEDSLGSDHCLLRITLLAKAAREEKGEANLTHWPKFRTQEMPSVLFSGGYAEWEKQLDTIQQQIVNDTSDY